MRSIADAVLARRGDTRPALHAGGRMWTWDEVVAEAAARAAALTANAPDGPFHIGVLLENVPEYVFVLLGGALAGAVIVGINPTRRGTELAADIAHTDCGLLVTDQTSLPLLEAVRGPRVLTIDGEEYAALLASHGGAACPAELPDPDALYLLLFTSGSTGAPKAVRMTQGRAARTASGSAIAFGPDDVLYCAMPLFHGNALLANFFPALVSGASVVLRRRFSATAFLTDIQSAGCTYFNYVGRALSYILAVPEKPEERDNALKWCLGSEASPRDIAEFTRRFGCPVFEGYGSSENAVVIQPAGGMPANALGKPARGLDVIIADPATGVECPPARFDAAGQMLNPGDAIGEIVGRNSAPSFEGYYANPDADAERTRGGWYWSGDLGYRDEDGWFFFAGRSADWLRVDGENFSSGPIERIVGRFPGAGGVAVYGVPDPVTGDQVMAAMELDLPFDGEVFAAFLAAQADLGTKWAPRFIRVLDALPVTATRKVDKQPLRRERWETADPVWWRPPGGTGYQRFDAPDAARLRAEFAAHGRESVLDRQA